MALEAIGKAIERHPKGGEGFLSEAKILLHAAMGLKKAWPTLGDFERRRARRKIETVTQLLLRPPRGDPLEESVANLVARTARLKPNPT